MKVIKRRKAISCSILPDNGEMSGERKKEKAKEREREGKREEKEKITMTD